MDDEAWRGMVSANHLFLSLNPMMLHAWTGMRHQVAPGFRDFMDEVVRDICTNQACPPGATPQDWEVPLESQVKAAIERR